MPYCDRLCRFDRSRRRTGRRVANAIRWVQSVAAGAGAVAINLWFALAPQTLSVYCGLSGVLNALLAAGLAIWWQRARDPLALLIGAGALAKIAVEMAVGNHLLPTTDWQSVPMADLLGFVAGFSVVMP